MQKNHRGSVSLTKNTPEELCVADADAISHFDSVPSLLYLAYVEKGMGIKEGKEFVKAKLARSFRKLSIESKNIIRTSLKKSWKSWGDSVRFIVETAKPIEPVNGQDERRKCDVCCQQPISLPACSFL